MAVVLPSGGKNNKWTVIGVRLFKILYIETISNIKLIKKS